MTYNSIYNYLQHPICGVSAARLKRLRWLGHVFRMPNDRLPEKLLLVKFRGFAHLAALGLVSMMLHYVIVKTVVLISLIGMPKTSCSGETQLVLHVPSSS